MDKMDDRRTFDRRLTKARAMAFAHGMLKALSAPPDPAVLREAADDIERILPDDEWASGVAAAYRVAAAEIEDGRDDGRSR